MSWFGKMLGGLDFSAGSSTPQISNFNEIRQNLTIDEISNLLTSGSGSYAGPSVTEATAMRVSAVYACVALVSGAISTLPMPVYERTKDGRERVDHPYFWLLNEQPHAEFSAAVFWEYMASARMFYGDCYAEIVRPYVSSSRSIGFKPHHPLRVTPFRDTNSTVLYRVSPINGAQYVVNAVDMIHVPSLGFDGLTSPSPITYAAKQAIGTSLATAEHNARFFSNGARPDFALKAKANMSEEQAKMLRNTWSTRHQGSANAHLPAILTGGLEIEKLSLSAADSQILQTAGWNLEEICRVLGVPPHMVGSTEKTSSWGSGVENMGRGFVKYTLLRDLRKFEQEFNRKCFPVREKYFFEFDVSGIERGDLKSESESLRIAIGGPGTGHGWMTPNEVRHHRLLPPIEGGDVLYDPSNPATTAASAVPVEAAAA